MLKHLSHPGMDLLLHIFNFSWFFISFLPSGRLNLLLSSKNGKISPHLLSSALSLVLKLFERIIPSRVLFFLKNISTLFPHQSDFCLIGLLSIKFFVLLSPCRMTYIYARMAINFSKTLNFVWLPTLLDKLISVCLLLALFDGLNLFLPRKALECFYKIKQVVFFNSTEMFR